MAYLPTNAQELLSSIFIMETAVTKLEEEMVSLHFQLIQERNERRLVEYRLKQMPPPACSCHSGKLELEDTTCKKCSQGEKVYARAVLHEQVMNTDSSRNSSMENQQSIQSPSENYLISALWSLSERLPYGTTKS